MRTIHGISPFSEHAGSYPQSTAAIIGRNAFSERYDLVPVIDIACHARVT